ncbi:MAG: insulinase family protein [Bacteroidaceae bacterium]|nr:insulinase family protein [Bacteroidaceae bacterium]
MNTFVFDNGLRVILAPSETNVVYAGIAVATGTRHELDTESGMAHLVEHMSFKGTARLSSVQILNRMESVGGDLNAYTGKEETVYYATFLRPHLKRAIPLLFDIVFSSTFPQAELDKEVEVVIDEIESYNDTPSDLIFDDFEGLLFPNHPLGRKILGNAERLRQYRTADLQRFVSRCYTPDRAVLFVKGNVSEEDIRSLIPRLPLERERGSICLFGVEDGKVTTPPLLLEKGAGGETCISKHTHQAHVMLGSRAYAANDPRRMGLYLLNNILGGPAMNSRLSLALRERTGLVYAVESNYTAYSDTGVWATYFGCDHADVRRCLRLVNRELQRLVERPLSSRMLAIAKRQLKGQMGIAYDNSENVALSMAKRFLHEGRVPTLEEMYQQIDDLSPEALQTIAEEHFAPDRLVTLIYQ